MKKITSLTQKQIDKFPEYVKKWTDIGLSTEPANRPEAEKAIKNCYTLAGINPPQKIIWCGSPLSKGLVREIFLNKKLNIKMGASVGDSVWASVGASVGDSVGVSVWDSVWASVGAFVGDSVGNSVWDSVRDSVWASVGNSVWDSVMDSVRASVGDSVWVSVWDSIRASVGDSVWVSVYGSHDAAWLSFYDYMREELNLKQQTNKLTGLIELAKNVGWCMPYENICFMSERHNVLNRDEQGRLHSLDQPAVMYPDGWKIYAVHGVRVPEKIITDPSSITVESIEGEKNSEIKRVMIEIYGNYRYLIDSGAELIGKDKFGELYRKDIENDEPLVMVKVINSTPEPDESLKEYFLRVPPHIDTAANAVAWTFGLDKKDYNPVIET